MIETAATVVTFVVAFCWPRAGDGWLSFADAAGWPGSAGYRLLRSELPRVCFYGRHCLMLPFPSRSFMTNSATLRPPTPLLRDD